MAKELPEPSLPPPHRGGEGARRRQPKAVFLKATQKDGHSCGKTACVVVVVVVVVVVEWLYYSKRIIIVRWADLSDFFR